MLRKKTIDNDGGRISDTEKGKRRARHHQKLSRLESTEIMENYAFIMGQTKWVEFLISGSAKPILDCENCTERT